MTPIRYIVEKALISIVNHDPLCTNFERNVDIMAQVIRYMDSRTQGVNVDKSLIARNYIFC